MTDAYSQGAERTGTTASGDEIELWLTDDEEDDVRSYKTSIDFYGMTFTFKFTSQEDATAFYTLLAKCIGIEEM